MPPQTAVWLKNAEETKLMSHWFSESDHLGPMCATCDQQSNKAVCWWNFDQELRKERLRRRSVNGKMQSGFLQYIHTHWLTGFFVHVVVSSIPAPLCAERFNETEWSEKLSWLVKNQCGIAVSDLWVLLYFNTSREEITHFPLWWPPPTAAAVYYTRACFVA